MHKIIWLLKALPPVCMKYTAQGESLVAKYRTRQSQVLYLSWDSHQGLHILCYLGCKKVWGQSEATLQTGKRDHKVWYQMKPRTSWMTHNIIAYFHKYDWLCHLATFIGTKKVAKWQSQSYYVAFVKICYNIEELKYFYKVANFLASADIKLFAMLLLNGLTHFYTPSVFV